jgi:putative hydrolase
MTPTDALNAVALREDMHVHSTYSDGTSTIAENLERAVRMGLTRIGCVDHVRRDTEWVPDFAAAVRQAAAGLPLEVSSGIEAKMLDGTGQLDLPRKRDGIDRIYIADHQVPLADGPHAPAEIRAALAAGRLLAGDVVDAIVGATVAALLSHPGSVIAHLFSLLPKLGLSEADVPADRLARLVWAARRSAALVEIDERWKCPSLRTARAFRDAGVPIIFSTDSHRAADIGRYVFARSVHEGLTS